MTYSFYQASACGRQFLIVDIVFLTVTFGIICLRFWSARYAGRKIYVDDYLSVLGFCSMILMASSSFWGVPNGLGMHIKILTPEQLTTLAKVLLFSEIAYLLGTAFTKLSMLSLYYRIYTIPVFRRWNYGVMTLVAIYFVSFIPFFLTNCIPISQYWDPKPTGWCRDTIIYDNATLGANFVLDFLVLCLPLPVLWGLKMSVRDKLTVTAMFGFGFVTIALVIWRLVVTEKTRGAPDWTASVCEVGVIAALELYLGVIAVCIPTLGPLFNAYVRPILGKLGISTTTVKPSMNHLYLKTFGSSGTNKRSRKYSELNDSADRIVSRDGSIKLTPTVDGKVVAECTSKPINETHTPDNDRGGIRVQRDFEAQYYPK